MRFSGDINMIDLRQLLNVTIPPQFISKFIPDRKWKKKFNDAFPAGIPIVLRGTTKDPKTDLGNMGTKIVAALAGGELEKYVPGAGGIIGDVLGGQRKPPAPAGTTQPADTGKFDPGTLLPGIFGPKKETPPKPEQPAPAPSPKKKKAK
jgi:hypothetical protein